MTDIIALQIVTDTGNPNCVVLNMEAKNTAHA